jgi:transposase-like protein
MSKSERRVFSRKFKLSAVNRMLRGENVSELARELQVLRKDLYVWRDRFRAGGPEALRGIGRPRKAAVQAAIPAKASPATLSELDVARKRVAELERKIGQQQVDLDFFQQALRQLKGARRPSNGPGAPASTPSSKR